MEESDRERRRSRAFLPFMDKIAIVMKLRRLAGAVRNDRDRVKMPGTALTRSIPHEDTALK